MAAMVVPLACRSIATTVACFEGALRLGSAETDCPDGFGVADFGFPVGLVARLALGRFGKRLVFFELSFLAAIWPSLCVNDSTMCCH